jgi:acyl transferase domain-containing protein
MKNFDIAIIGIGCRFPGGASSPEAFWDLLKNGVDAVGDVPGDRWDNRRFYDPDVEKPGKIYSRQGGFIKEKLGEFDPLFFGISPREARSLDPQQRILLEITYEAIEDAGVRVEKLSGTPTGVYIGAYNTDNLVLQFSPFNRYLDHAHANTTISLAFLSNRISHAFDLRGPSMTIDTACSSSITVLHTAFQAMWNRDISMAVVGGINIMFLPAKCLASTKAQVLSADCRCKSFDADADGYVRSEGGGVVILKPYEQAVEDKDNIYAVVKAVGLNQDGRTRGIAKPNPDAQKELIKKIYKQAGIDIGRLHYIEAHGTGTPVGDRTELQVLKDILSENGTPGKKYWLGSVKTNIGHVEAAAGIAGLIKCTLALYHKQIPPNLHFQNLNPNFDPETLPLRVVTQLTDLPPNEVGYIALNSFGLGGSNGHVILQEAPKQPKQGVKDNSTPHHILLPISARAPGALKDLAKKYYDFIVNEKPGMHHLLYTAGLRRSHHKNRLVIAARTRKQLLERLASYTHGELPAGVIENEVDNEETPRLVFVYPPPHPRWKSIARELLEKAPVFSRAVKKYEKRFVRQLGRSIFDEIQADPNSLPITPEEQGAHLIYQAAQTELLKSWGIIPAAVVGDSQGEAASAVVSGKLSLEDALAVIHNMGRPPQKNITVNKSLIPLYSPVTGKQAVDSDWDADYWQAGPEAPGRFSKAVQTLIDDGYSIFIEVGQQPSLKHTLNHAFHSAGIEGHAIQLYKEENAGMGQLYEAVARLHTLGVDIDWECIAPRGRYIKLPRYPWQKEHYWCESGQSRQDRLGLPGSVMLNTRVPSPFPTWDVELNRLFFPFIADYKVQGTVVIPDAIFVCAGLSVSREKFDGSSGITLENIRFKQTLPMETRRVQMLRTIFYPGNNEYQVFSWNQEEDPGWKLHATGGIKKEPLYGTTPGMNIDEIKARCPAVVPAGDIYEKFASMQFEYGPYLRTVKDAGKGKDEGMVKIGVHRSLAADFDPGEYFIHPTVLEGAFQGIAIFADMPVTPASIGRITCFFPPGPGCWCHVRITRRINGSITGDVILFDGNGRTAVKIDNVVCRNPLHRQVPESAEMGRGFYEPAVEAGTTDYQYMELIDRQLEIMDWQLESLGREQGPPKK